MFTQVDHIGICVKEIDQAARLYGEAFSPVPIGGPLDYLAMV